jgi:hypothetical protein
MGTMRGCEAEIEKPLRETDKLLKSFKTAKSSDFRTQRYQRLSKTHDFAGETISLRFARNSFRRVGGVTRAKIWKTRRIAKNPFRAS